MSIPINENTISDIIRPKLERVLLETLKENERLREENNRYVYAIFAFEEAFDEVKRKNNII